MVTFSYERIKFRKAEDGVEAVFMKNFCFDLPDKELSSIGEYTVVDEALVFEKTPAKRAEKRFGQLLAKGFDELYVRRSKKKALYIHSNSGIPLFGSNAVGIVDRGTNIIEVKPITGCNINCIYCSVNEDRRDVDYIVEPEYMVEEFRKLAELKGNDHIEAHIGTQGEPTLYAGLEDLCRGLRSIPQVKIVSIDTNGTLLTPAVVDRLVEAGLTRFNFSINAFSQENAERIADAPYNLEKIKKLFQYIPTKCDLIVAPVLIPKHNEEDIDQIVGFVKTLPHQERITIGIQNFLHYKSGRNPSKPWDYDKFYDYLRKLEEKHNVKLILSEEDFLIEKTKTYPSAFKKGEVITAPIVAPGRFPGEAIAVARDRIVTLMNCHKTGKVSFRITKTKHGVYYGECV